jgi:hypothetical protein
LNFWPRTHRFERDASSPFGAQIETAGSSIGADVRHPGYQDGMSLVGHIGSILLRLPQQGSIAPLVHHSNEKRVTGRSRGLGRT